MRVLFVGGTGIISTAATRLAAERGIELTLIVRGQHSAALPPAVNTIAVNVGDPESTNAALRDQQFDAVVDWIAFTPEDIERDLALFRGRTRQFVFISSASAYQKPQTHYLITEATPLANPYWQYSRDKIACEERLMKAYQEEGFPVTIVRPSLTYGQTMVPLVMNSWQNPYTVVNRLRRGQKVIVPGDGTSLWTITHNSDFAKGLVGLLGNPQAIGHAFHITSDEVMTWEQYYRITAEAIGVEPRIVHMSSDFIIACSPEFQGTLLGDKAVSVVFDNSKIKRFVPGFCATTSFAKGIRQSLAWFEGDSERRQVDERHDSQLNRLIAAYEDLLLEAKARFQDAR